MAATVKTVLILMVTCASLAHAQSQFEQLFVFGDSLSDVGNFFDATFELEPDSRYFEGRFSNGPVYSELFAELMELDPLLPSNNGGTNYAFAGGRTADTPFFAGGFFINDLDDQVNEFLDGNAVPSDALYLVLAGGNDFVLGETTNAAAPAGRVVDQIERLTNAGARNVLSINLPLLGDVPRFQDERQVLNERTETFNRILNDELDDLQARDPELSVMRLDIASLFVQLVSHPEEFGFTNVTDEGINADDAEGFLFWDCVHPTAEAHQLLARAAFRLYDDDPLIGDFNLSNELDVSDLDLLSFAIQDEGETFGPEFDLNQDAVVSLDDIDWWLQESGTVNGDINLDQQVGFQDFLALSRNFGDEGAWSDGDLNADGSVSFPDFLVLSRNFGVVSASVPEPSGWSSTMWLSLALFLNSGRQRRRLRLPSAQGRSYRR